MTPHKYQIFVSSTYTDLLDIRRAIIDAIHKMNHFAVGMEQFSAAEDEQWEVIQDTIRQSDYYICIVGHRYGSISPDGNSYTEREWNFAKEQGIPIMSFVRERDAATTPQERESEKTKVRMLERFLKKVKDDKMVESWEKISDLAPKVLTALYKAFLRRPRPGWIRTESQLVAEEMAVLMEENRRLKKQVEALSAESRGTRPSFTLRFNGQEKLLLEVPPKAEISFTPLPKISRLSWDSVCEELREFTSISEIDSYNSQLPSAEEIQETYSRLWEYERAEAVHSRFTILVGNTGSAKASEVFLEITFPDWLSFMEKSEFEKMVPPRMKFPRNPLLDAKEKADRKKLGGFWNNLETEGARGDFTKIRTLLPSIPDLSRLYPQEDYCSAEGNKLSIWIKDIMHTRRREFSDLIIIPKEVGEGQAEISVICEQFPAKEILLIPVVVSESKRS
jgi:hypothetical protein